MTRHPGFPLRGIRPGGVLTEALDDISIRLAPLTRTDAFDMMDDIAARRILDDYRGMKPVDREAIADILVALGNLALHFPLIREIDLNPVIVVDGRPFVADALVVV